MTNADARSVIAQGMFEAEEEWRLDAGGGEVEMRACANHRADSILAALDQAGFEIVKKRERFQVQSLDGMTVIVDPSAPNNEIWFDQDSDNDPGDFNCLAVMVRHEGRYWRDVAYPGMKLSDGRKIAHDEGIFYKIVEDTADE